LVAGAGKECGVMAFPKEISEFMATYKVSFDEVWKIPQGNAYAIKHKALERVAAEQGIRFDRPAIIQSDLANKVVAMAVFASMGERQEWATGEAAPYNNKNGYPLAMSEKRAKDRCILKLLQAHGALYSEDEADDFKRPNPHVTRPEDIVPATEYDQHGEPVDNIPHGDPSIEQLKKKDARKDYEAAQKEMRATKDIGALTDWGTKNANRVASYPADWQEIFRGLYIEHRDDLRAAKQEAA
jgi:hypothetical protein